MAKQGLYKLQGVVDVAAAYVVVDAVSLTKGGNGQCHVSVYANAPVVVTEMQQHLNPDSKIIEDIQVSRKDRGPVLEHWTIDGITVVGADPFVAAYEQIGKLDDRLTDMKSA